MSTANIIASIAIGVTILIAFFGLWWKAEKDQDKALQKLHDCNDKAHKEIRGEIEEVKDEMTRQHFTLRDKIEDLLKIVLKWDK